MNKQELIERIEDFPCEASLVTEMIRINKNALLGWVKELDEPERVQIPQDIADYIKYAKENDWDLQDAMNLIVDEADGSFSDWFYKDENMETFALAWIYGWEVEKEKKYTVKFKATKQYLCNDEIGPHFSPSFRTNFRRSDLEKLGFGWVFDCEGIELEEITK